MNNIHTRLTDAVRLTDSLPTLHLVIPPGGEKEALEQALARRPDLLVLNWRLAVKTVRLLTDTDLGKSMRQHLEDGGHVVVWHGEQSLDYSQLRHHLGPQWARLCDGRLTWSRIRRVQTPGTEPWNALAERLDRPDETVVRQMFFSDGQNLPRWHALDEALNRQARIAHAAWYQAHLAPLQSALDETVTDQPAEVTPTLEATETDKREDSENWWLSSIATGARLSGSQNLAASVIPFSPTGATVHTGLHASSRPANPKPDVIAAQPQPTPHPRLWRAETWLQHVRIRPGVAVPWVEITRKLNDMTCQIVVKLPSQSGTSQWRLTLYPENELPFLLNFVLQAGQTEVRPPWPQAHDLQPDEKFWASIRAGSVELKQLGRSGSTP